MSEEIQRNLNIESTIKDGRVNIVFSQYIDDDPFDEIAMVELLTASLSMALKAATEKMDYEMQGQLMTTVIDNLEQSFVTHDSFKNLHRGERPKKDE